MSDEKSKPRAPAGLGTDGKRLWRSINEDYALGAGDLRILHDAAAEADLIAAMEAEWKALGSPMTSRGSQGQTVAHPIVSELRQHRNTVRSLIGALKLPQDAEEEDDESQGSIIRPDGSRRMSRTESARKAAQTRWGTRNGTTA